MLRYIDGSRQDATAWAADLLLTGMVDAAEASRRAARALRYRRGARVVLATGGVPQPTWGEDADFVESMLHAIPSKWAVRQLRLARLRNPQAKYSGNELNNVNALSLAVVYCDVVVTEKNVGPPRRRARHNRHPQPCRPLRHRHR